jgi:hypothetical protein
MNDQLSVMRDQMKDARAAARSADVTTDRQLKIAEKQAGSQQTLADANKDIANAANSQWHVMERQAALMQDQLTAASAAAKDSASAIERQLRVAETQAGSMKTLADATRDVADASKETMHVDQRAWIGVEHVDVTEATPAFSRLFFRDRWAILVIFRNTGKTPAMGVQGTAIIETVNAPTAADFAAVSKWTAKYGHIPPGQEFAMRTRLKDGKLSMPVSHKTFVLSEDAVYVYGHISYNDIFGMPHWVDFCQVLEHGTWAVYHQHNDDDSHVHAFQQMQNPLTPTPSPQPATPPELVKPPV